MELVEAGKGEDLLSIFVFIDADGALALMVILYLLLVFPRGVISRPWQLRQNVHFDRLLVVAHEEFIHVVLELLLTHVVDVLVRLDFLAVAARDKSPFDPMHHWPNRVHECSELSRCQVYTTPLLCYESIKSTEWLISSRSTISPLLSLL